MEANTYIHTPTQTYIHTKDIHYHKSMCSLLLKVCVSKVIQCLQGPWVHLLATAVHGPRGGQGGGVGRQAPHQRRNRPAGAHAAGRAHLPHQQLGLGLPQAAHGLR